MERRTMLKSVGAALLGGWMPTEANAKSLPDHKTSIETDILVVGGGTAGVIAAIQAARAGCKTILLESGGCLGGTITTGGVSFPGIFHAWGRQVIKGIGWELVSEAVSLAEGELPDFSKATGRQHWRHQIRLNGPTYIILAEEKCLQAGVDIRYYETPVRIHKRNGIWEIDIVGKGTSYTIQCKQLVDCTGNALITSMAGYRVVKDKETQPGSLIFELGGYDIQKLDADALKERHKAAIEAGILHKADAYNGIMALLNINGGLATQHVLHADSTTSQTHTVANIAGRTSMLRIIRFVKTLPGCEKAYITKMQPETAIRETYRIDGMYTITHDDYVEGKLFNDSLSYSFYPIDLHVEEGVKPKHLQEGKVATIPLRALIPKGSENFIVAGRCISSDRLANSALRVQASCMGMGQVAGATAALACKAQISPINVPIDDIKLLLKQNEAIIP